MSNTEIVLAKRSLSQFGIIGSLRRVATGLDSTYRVKAKDGRVFALRVSGGLPIRRVSAFCVEAEWIDALASNRRFCIPQVHRTENGEHVGQVTDDDGVVRASTLLSWIPGRRCYQPSTLHARALGQMAGALHQHAQTFDAPPTDAIKSWDASLMCLMPRNPKEGLYQIDPKAAEQVHRIYLGLERMVAALDERENGLINADLGVHNVLWHKGQAGLVDFNDTGIGPFAFCLARLVERIRRNERGQRLADELLSGYQEVAPLPSAYEQWGGLFEMAADAFRLNYGAERAVRLGAPLRESEQRIVCTLHCKIEQLGL